MLEERKRHFRTLIASCFKKGPVCGPVVLQGRALGWWPARIKMPSCNIEYRVDRNSRLKKTFLSSAAPHCLDVSLSWIFSELDFQLLGNYIDHCTSTWGFIPSPFLFSDLLQKQWTGRTQGLVRATCYQFPSKLIWKPGLWMKKETVPKKWS